MVTLRKNYTNRFLEFTPLQIAQALTLREQTLLHNIPVRNFIKQAWTKDDPAKGAELKKLIEHFNFVSGMVVTEIVTQNNANVRAQAIGKWIDVGIELRELRNMNTLYAVVAGTFGPNLRTGW